MILRLAFFALMALGLCGFGTVAWLSTRPPPPDPAAQVAATRIMVLAAAKPVRAGNLLKPEDIMAKEVTVGDAGDDTEHDTPDARRLLVGSMVRSSLVVGDIIRRKDVMSPGDHGFLAAVLAPGMRAVSLSVDAITGEAGLIWPGDRIDLILTQNIGDNNSPAGHRIASETVLSGVRVIAIDQQLVQGVAPDGSEKNARTVTMEVTQEQAERISVANRIGHLSLAVRSAERGPNDEAIVHPPTTWASDVSPALRVATPPEVPHATIKIFGGADESKEFKF